MRSQTQSPPSFLCSAPRAAPRLLPQSRLHAGTPTSTPCGSRTRPLRLERPPISPEIQRGITRTVAPIHLPIHPGKSEPAGGHFYPRPARLPFLARQGLSARIQFGAFRATRLQTQNQPLLDSARKAGREIDRLRGNGGAPARCVKFSARVPEGHGCIGCKLLTVLWGAVVCWCPLAVYAK